MHCSHCEAFRVVGLKRKWGKREKEYMRKKRYRENSRERN